MKKRVMVSIIVVLALFSLNACYGSFSATKKIYKWNGTFGNKFVKTLVMWGLHIIPVYELGATADLLILNTIEFWTGSNPLAISGDKKETQLVTVDGESYLLTARKDRMDIECLSNHSLTSLHYDRTSDIMSLKTGEDSFPIAEK